MILAPERQINICVCIIHLHHFNALLLIAYEELWCPAFLTRRLEGTERAGKLIRGGGGSTNFPVSRQPDWLSRDTNICFS